MVISAGIYFGLAYPFPVLSQSVSLTGILSQTEISVVITWPNAQMKLIITLTSATAIWGFEIRDASNNYVHGQAGISTSTYTIETPWLDASGSYTIFITCIGDLDGMVTVFARGWPFITA